jgi:hypothetical protein
MGLSIKGVVFASAGKSAQAPPHEQRQYHSRSEQQLFARAILICLLATNTCLDDGIGTLQLVTRAVANSLRAIGMGATEKVVDAERTGAAGRC